MPLLDGQALEHVHSSGAFALKQTDHSFTFVLELLLSLPCVELNPLFHSHLLFRAAQFLALFEQPFHTILLVSACLWSAKDSIQIGW